MRLFLLTALTMVAFAANSVLNRLALVGGEMDASWFGTIRLAAGALMLAAICLIRSGQLHLRAPRRWVGVGALLVYVYGFSLAYVVLDAGLGALVLFGFVQISMFAGSLWGGERPPARRWIGAAMAFAGLVWLLAPGVGADISLPHGLLMAAAGIGWGIYSLAGRGAGDPAMGTAANFILAAPIGLALSLAVAPLPDLPASGMALAVLSGAVTSALGYILWYSVLPQLPASVAAVAQLTVPIIALAGGMIFLGEALTLTFALASILVLGGVAVSVLPFSKRR
ncbi:EamA-like transporter family protein [Roseivivax sp. THAF40]|uniref:DMT family transporter n=1 Tax=unclassified Roseivivax TaxID=2639302 RepID=UPI001267C3BF|nr:MULTISPECIES: DMT family transporter [unclassified Roseivivax]QFS81911.1 EamA-like transporter family protein [Roseivivax sp. THAF197b]QFT45711.1 EamA-like transporter family protein [Roseivivax sp. THAF40]